ncbi:hypothetical protein CPC08DRAFT_709688 [Agrocybe pediades]|nr:hypothetical protein CPC08DRAFT_709688 [Agrocybe pediades]
MMDGTHTTCFLFFSIGYSLYYDPREPRRRQRQPESGTRIQQFRQPPQEAPNPAALPPLIKPVSVSLSTLMMLHMRMCESAPDKF